MARRPISGWPPPGSRTSSWSPGRAARRCCPTWPSRSSSTSSGSRTALKYVRRHDFDTIEPTPLAEAGWDQHVQDCGNITLYPTANSWYMGSNVPGKPRVFLPYIGGVDAYRAACDEVVADDYLGFTLAGAGDLADPRRGGPPAPARRGHGARHDGRSGPAARSSR